MGWAVLAWVVAQRLAELALARRNTRRLMAAGAIESGRRHYPLFVLLHSAWLAAIAVMVAKGATISWPLIAAYVALQPLRLWIIATLGPRWTTRVITLRNAPPVRGGPYRFCRHPNYVVVAAEIALLPAAFGAWRLALVFSLASAALTAWRIRVEDAALNQSSAAATNI